MNKTLRAVLVVFVALVLVVCGFGGGFAAGRFLPSLGPGGVAVIPTLPASANQADTGTPADLQSLFSPFWEAWNIVHQEYLVQPLDDTQLMQGAIRGMMDALGDKHSSYMDPQEYADANAQMQGEYAGIGAYVDTDAEYLTIVRPIAGSPAEQVGLQPGDEVLAVDGVDMTGVDASLVRMKVLGPEGTKVTLTIQRSGVDQPFDVEITRARIVIPSVESEMLDHNIAYVKISVFGENTAQDLHDQLQQLMAQNPSGLILDLRDNTGGYLDAAVKVGSEFLDSGVVLYEQDRSGNKQPYSVISGGLATKVPMVVLVNGYTASASEIVSGAIQDDGRGKLVGVTTYGKGTVQNWIPLSNNEGAVRVTIARWLTPDERTIDGTGLTPDVVVEMTQDDYAANRDPQRDAAIQLLLNPGG